MDAGLLMTVLVAVAAATLAATLTAVLLSRRRPGAQPAAEGEHRRLLDEVTREAVRAALDTTGRQVLDQLVRTNEERLRSQQQASEAQARRAQASLSDLVDPLRSELQRLEDQIHGLERARVEAYTRLTGQVESTGVQLRELQQVTTQLDAAMRSNQSRGRWGEIQLQRVVELVGLKEHVSYASQQQQVGSGQGRPDLTVFLTDDQVLYVDAKAPMAAYLRAVEAPDDTTREQSLQAHARALREHARALAGRGYLEDGHSVGLVVLFVPNEAALAAALDADRDLLAAALELRVAITGPTSLAMMLTNINASWRQHELAQNTTRIVAEVQVVHDRLRVFAGHLARLGKGLDDAIDAYNRAVGSFDSRLVPVARNLERLAAVSADAEVPALPRIDVQARTPALATDIDEPDPYPESSPPPDPEPS